MKLDTTFSIGDKVKHVREDFLPELMPPSMTITSLCIHFYTTYKGEYKYEESYGVKEYPGELSVDELIGLVDA